MDVKLVTLKVNNAVLIKPGEKIPADSVVVSSKPYERKRAHG